MIETLGQRQHDDSRDEKQSGHPGIPATRVLGKGQSPARDHAARSSSGASSVSAAGLRGQIGQRGDGESLLAGDGEKQPCRPGSTPRRPGERAGSPGRSVAWSLRPRPRGSRSGRRDRDQKKCGPNPASKTPATAAPTERRSTSPPAAEPGPATTKQPARRSPGQTGGPPDHSDRRRARAQRRRAGNSPDRPPGQHNADHQQGASRHSPKPRPRSPDHPSEQGGQPDEDQGELDRGEVARQTACAIPRTQRRQREHQCTQTGAPPAAWPRESGNRTVLPTNANQPQSVWIKSCTPGRQQDGASAESARIPSETGPSRPARPPATDRQCG